MENRDTSNSGAPLRHGVLHTPPKAWWRLQRFEVPVDLAETLSHTWVASRRLPAGRTHRQSVLPHPAANLVVEDGAAWLYGPQSQRFDRDLRGTGRVVGLRFRPAVLRALTGKTAERLVDRTVPVADLGLDGAAITARVEAEVDDERAATALVDAVRTAIPARIEPVVADLRDLVESIAGDRSLTRTQDLADRLHVAPRTLQRRFADHVGPSPAWVLRRYRIQDVLARAGESADPDWATLAQQTGYYDQAHLVRDVTDTVGTSPAAYLHRTSAEPNE